MLNIAHYKTHADHSYKKELLHTRPVGRIKKFRNSKCWIEHGEKGTYTDSWVSEHVHAC